MAIKKKVQKKAVTKQTSMKDKSMKNTLRMKKKPEPKPARLALSGQHIRPKNHADDSQLYADEEQGILAQETDEEIEDDMVMGKRNRDIYNPAGRDLMEEEDEIEPWEEGFMEGATDFGQLGKDALTGAPLMAGDTVVETKINGKLYRFSSRKNAEAFRKKVEKGKK